MAPLLCHRYYATSGGTGTDRMRVGDLGHVILRLITVNDLTTACAISVDFIDRNAPANTDEYLPLIPFVDMTAPMYGVGWEGEIELGFDQDVLVTYVGAVAADRFEVIIGYEIIEEEKK